MTDNLIERKAFADFLLGNYSDVYTQENVDHYIEHNHVSWLAWQGRAAIERQSVPAGWYITKAEAMADAEEQAISAAAPQPQQKKCWCAACDMAKNVIQTRMALCPECGDKRCPKAMHHDAACSAAPQPQPVQEPVAWSERIKELADQYAIECVEFSKGIPNGAHSMSPIAVKAGDTRLALHSAIDTGERLIRAIESATLAAQVERATQPQPVQEPVAPVGTVTRYLGNDGHMKWAFQPEAAAWLVPRDQRAAERGAESCFSVYTSPQAQPLSDADVQQISRALHRHGLTLVRTVQGFGVMKLGEITAYAATRRAIVRAAAELGKETK